MSSMKDSCVASVLLRLPAHGHPTYLELFIDVDRWRFDPPAPLEAQ